MTNAELIARLQNSKGWPTLGNAAADRIEQLVATNEALSISNATLIAERDAVEAKLAKAVEALLVVDALDPESLVGGCSRDALSGLVNRMGDKARTTLAELKGKSHE